MYTMFLVFALLGGTVFVIQFVMAIIGFGADDLDFAEDIPDDIPDDVGDVIDHGSTWLFGVISFRTIVAAATFFGIAGMASLQSELSPLLSLLIALFFGASAMYGVHYVMLLLFRFQQDGTQRIKHAVGTTGTVYVPIPGENAGVGKVQLRMRGRIVEFQAMTADSEKLTTGTKVTVLSVVGPGTVEVTPIHESVKPAETTA